MTTELDLLIAAREDYEQHGFAVGRFTDYSGNRCALGSLNHAAFLLTLRNNPVRAHAHQRLGKHAIERYGMAPVGVNDNPKLGRKAILDCFDAAIKECREEEVGNINES